MNNEKTMRFEVTTTGNCFLHGFETMKEAFDYANNLDIKTKVFDSLYGMTYEVSGTKRSVKKMDEIMKIIYNAMCDYNYHYKLNVNDELMSRKRAYLRGLIDMLRCFNLKCVVLYESYTMNSKISDIIIDVDDMSVSEWYKRSAEQ